MSDDWNEFMPDDGDYGITFGEAVRDVVMFLAKVLGYLLAAALAVFFVVYSVFREYAIISFLTSQ